MDSEDRILVVVILAWVILMAIMLNGIVAEIRSDNEVKRAAIEAGCEVTG